MAPAGTSRRAMKVRYRRRPMTARKHQTKAEQPSSIPHTSAQEEIDGAEKQGGGRAANCLDLDGDQNNSGCTTPTAPHFRIPELSSCPPPPKKQRVLFPFTRKNSSISFFHPPEADLLFLFALHGGAL